MLNISVTMIGGEDPSGGISQLKNHLQETEANGATENNGAGGKSDNELVEVKEHGAAGHDGPVPAVIINSGT